MAEMNLLKALNENTATEGGYLVPEEWSAKLYDLITAKSTAIQLCEQATMMSDTLYVPKVTAATTAYFTDEAATITAAQPTFGQLEMHPKKVAALTRLSSEVLEDSNPAVMDIVVNRLASDVALKIDNEIYNGTATATGYIGMRAGAGSEVKVNTTITTDHISNAILALQEENLEPTDLVIHPRVLNQLRLLKTTTTSNEPLLNMVDFGSAPLGNGVVGKIWGINVIVTTQLPTDVTGTGTITHNGTDALLVARGKCGVFARRREMRLNKEYQIKEDDWIVQTTMRAAFAVNYDKAICKLSHIDAEV